MKTAFRILTLFVAALFMACGSTTTETGSTTSSNSTRRTSTNTTTSVDGVEMRGNPTATTRNDGEMVRTTTTTTNDAAVNSIGNGNREQSIYNTNPNKVAPVNQVDYDMQRTKEMYTSLNMTDDQITRYETATRASRASWKLSNAERAITAQQRLDQEDATIKAILDAYQYKNYQEWLRINPYRD